ncbi:MAG TPA: hypothetical protein VNC84_00205 [Gammaproteobacteria bacterium]|jgi:hypothetical protein|nr:hypothetical protein [Gammaproteobacteria bacterium]
MTKLQRLLALFCFCAPTYTLALAPDASDLRDIYATTKPDAAAAFPHETGYVEFHVPQRRQEVQIGNVYVGTDYFDTTKKCPSGFNPYVVITPQQLLTQGQGQNSVCVRQQIADDSGAEHYSVPYAVTLNSDNITSNINFTWTLYCTKQPQPQTICQFTLPDYYQPPILWITGYTKGQGGGASQSFRIGGSMCPKDWKPYVTVAPISIINSYPVTGANALSASINNFGACVVNVTDAAGYYYIVNYLVSAKMAVVSSKLWPDNVFVSYTRRFALDTARSMRTLLPVDAYNNLQTNPVADVNQNVTEIQWRLYCYPPKSHLPRSNPDCDPGLLPYGGNVVPTSPSPS